ncbi:MAG TPA: threonine synthase [Propionibacteriaceae bacterium]|nr:threonine synthase [Propionibacteriaceae bacterium]
MRYISTRSLPGSAGRRFSDILLEGLAPDGGLYLPERYPDLSGRLDELRAALDESYATLAASVLREFVDDIPAADLDDLCARAYSPDVFASPDIVPVDELGDGLWLAHTSEGPTAAFKDMAMQLLGQLFEYELTRRDGTLNILGATSGDTGSAAEYAMLGRDRLTVFMLTPAGRMTPFQQAQMFSLDDPRIVNIAVDGVFDDCQDLVKAVANDLEFKRRWRIGAVNSINWARLMAQTVYYIAAWIRASGGNDDLVDVTVPSGNFGNVCAAHVARQMGIPLGRLVVATNENDVLDEFFRTGVYRVRAASETPATSSPSMDISKASNFERFVFDLLGRDGVRTAALFGDELPRRGFFDLSGTPEFASIGARFGFTSGSSSHADRVATIRRVREHYGVLVDPHTADGLQVAAPRVRPGVPMVVVETALPVKFSATVEEALGEAPPVPPQFAGLLEAPRHVVDLVPDAGALKTLIAERLTALGELPSE